MSWKSRSKGDRTNRGSRPGIGASRGQPLHRWQDATSASQRSRARTRRPFGRWVPTAAVGLGLLGLLVYLWIIRERVSQIIVLTATDYQLPAPLNPWAVEDGNALKGLESKNLWPVSDISDKWNKQPNAASLRELLVDEIGKRSVPLIVHISMHGVVNDDNKPCLLPPGPAAADAKNWIPVEVVLKHISDAVHDRRKALVILDCNRIRANWQLGIVYNTFTERLQQLLSSNPIPDVAVLCSAGPGQINWSSADLNGSSFGRYLQLGLAGEADNAEGADGNGAVSLHELVAYLQREVNAWSESNRGEPQTPTLIPASAADFHLTWKVRGFGTLKGFVTELHEQKRSEPTIAPGDIAALWSQLDELRSLELKADETADIAKLQPLDLIRKDPVACRDLEFSLLRVEALSRGGLAYKQSAGDQFTRLKASLSDAVQQKNRTTNSRAVADHLGYGKIDEWARIRTAAHSLPAAEYFGASNDDSSKEIQKLWDTLTTPSASNSSSLTTAGSQEGVARELAETQLLIAARQQGADSLWPPEERYSLKNLLKLRSHAEELAVPRDPDGTPGDERAHFFARYALKTADERRRLAEDVLFIGPQSSQDYAELASAAEELYDWTSKVMHEATSAYAVRDAALAEAPYFGYWLCGPAIANVQDRKALINELLGLVRKVHDLDEQISHPEKLDANALPEKSGLPFYPLASEVFKHHRSLEVAFKQKYEELVDKGAQGPSGWTALNGALLTPLIPANKRAELLALQDEVSKNLYKEYFKKKAGAQTTSNESDPDKRTSHASADSPSPYLQELQTWESHPLVEILLPKENANAANNDIAWCDSVAKQLRERLSGLSSSRAGNNDSPQDRRDNYGIRDRQELSKAERALRASLSVGSGLGVMKSDPVFELRQFDLRQLLVSQGERAMDDFWGDSKGIEPPFFVRAARDYFEAARDLGTPTPGFRALVDKLDEKLVKLEDSKRQQLQMKATPQLVNEETGEVDVKLDVTAKASEFPVGQAALFVRSGSRGERLKFPFTDPTSDAGGFLKYPPTRAAQTFIMSIQAAPSEPRAEAVSFFRGKEDRAEFEMRSFGGVRVEYEPHVYNGQSITLSGDNPERLSLVFVLDCSNSMKAKSKVEANGGERVRMEIAKDHLNTMLRDIANRNRDGDGTHVGVRLFGHRLGWSQAPEPVPAGWTATLVANKGYRGKKPERPSPAEDVEVVQPLGIFNSGLASDIETLLKTVKPFGETPLYMSLSDALDDFASDDPNSRKSIVVITDGDDKQYDHPGVTPPRKVSLQELLIKGDQRKIPIHILAFDLAAVGADKVRENFDKIADATGGSFTEIQSGRELLVNLREHLNVAGYDVSDSGGLPVNGTNQGDTEQVKLGTPVTISNQHPLPDKFQVSFRDVKKNVRLEGGEALQLYVKKNGAFHDIVAHEYRRLTQASAYLRQGGQDTDCLLRVHQPVRSKGSLVEFPISLQRDTRTSYFTQRPAEIWLEITPLDDSDSGQSKPHEPYVFYDTNFEPHQPVPVLACPAVDWRDWPKARVKFWCKSRPTDPVLEVGLRDASFQTPQSVPNVNGVQLRMDKSESRGIYRVYVAEYHNEPVTDIDALRVQLRTHPQYKPKYVRHQFDREARLATHSFEFDASQRKGIEDFAESRIVVTKADDIKDGALQVAEDSPIEVSVQVDSGFHTTGAVSNGQ